MIMLKKLLFYIAIPLIFGFVGNLLGNSSMGYDTLAQPTFAPPAILFPIVWTILYVLMGISSYIISEKNNPNSKNVLTIYLIQLVANSVWTFFFFNLKWYLFSFMWILLLVILVAIMIYKFYKISPIAAYLQVPYILWLTFAAILSYNIYLLN